MGFVLNGFQGLSLRKQRRRWSFASVHVVGVDGADSCAVMLTLLILQKTFFYPKCVGIFCSNPPSGMGFSVVVNQLGRSVVSLLVSAFRGHVEQKRDEEPRDTVTLSLFHSWSGNRCLLQRMQFLNTL